MKGIERFYKQEIVISGKDISGKKTGFDYCVGKIEVSERKIFVCLDVRDYVKFGKRWISYDHPIEKIFINDDTKAEYRNPPIREKVVIRNKKVYIEHTTEKLHVEGDDLNRVYCYDYDGNMLWQMKPPEFKEFPKFKQYPIIGMEYDRKKKKLFAVDWARRYFDINLETGEPMSFEIKKI